MSMLMKRGRCPFCLRGGASSRILWFVLAIGAFVGLAAVHAGIPHDAPEAGTKGTSALRRMHRPAPVSEFMTDGLRRRRDFLRHKDGYRGPPKWHAAFTPGKSSKMKPFRSSFAIKMLPSSVTEAVQAHGAGAVIWAANFTRPDQWAQ